MHPIALIASPLALLRLRSRADEPSVVPAAAQAIEARATWIWMMAVLPLADSACEYKDHRFRGSNQPIKVESLPKAGR